MCVCVRGQGCWFYLNANSAVCWFRIIICGRRKITCGEPKFPHAWNFSSSVCLGSLTAPLTLSDHVVRGPACSSGFDRDAAIHEAFNREFRKIERFPMCVSPTFCVSSRVSGALLSPGLKGTGTPPLPLEKQHVHPYHKPYSHYHHHQSANDGKADPKTSGWTYSAACFRKSLLTWIWKCSLEFQFHILNYCCYRWYSNTSEY